MDIAVRILVGLIVFGFVGWITYFLFGVLELIFNGTAYAAGRGLRKLSGASGSHAGIAGFAGGLVEITKGLYGFAIFVAIFSYSFFYPNLQSVSNTAMAIALGCLLLLWAPSVFLLGFAGAGTRQTDDGPPDEMVPMNRQVPDDAVSFKMYRRQLAELGISGSDLKMYRTELAELGITGPHADTLVRHLLSTGERYYVTESALNEFQETAVAAGLGPIEFIPLLREYAETGIRPEIPR